MGQAAKANIAIYLKEGVDAPLGLSSKTAVEQTLIDFYFEQKPEAVGEPDFTVTDVQLFEGVIELELYSGRKANLDFQLETLMDFLDEKHDEDIEEVTDSVWVQA